MMAKEFTRKQVENLLQMPGKAIQYYSDRGILQSFNMSVGKGVPRKYCKKDVVSLAFIKELSEYGLTVGKIVTVLFYFYQTDKLWWNQKREKLAGDHFYFFIYRSIKGAKMRVKWSKEVDEVEYMFLESSSMLIVDLGGVLRGIDLS